MNKTPQILPYAHFSLTKSHNQKKKNETLELQLMMKTAFVTIPAQEQEPTESQKLSSDKCSKETGWTSPQN